MAAIQQIVTFLNDIQEGLCEDEVSPMQLTELYRVIRVRMDEPFKAQDKVWKVLLASLEYRTSQYKQALQERLGVRNWRSATRSGLSGDSVVNLPVA